MGIYLADQVFVFVSSLLVGAAFGLLYDVFRISRIAFRTPRAVIFIEDVLFFIVCAVITFFFALTVIDGSLRVFLLIGEALGWIIYFFTLGQLVMGVAKKIIAAIKAVAHFIFKWILRPIWLLLYHLIALILRPFVFLQRIAKKILQNTKFRLKVRRKVLYNQWTGYFKKLKKAGRRKNGNSQAGSP